MLYRPPTAAIERHALDIAAEFDRKIGPFRAEIVPDATPAWYVLRTTPGQEDKAARFLEARAIGVFLPRFVAGSRMVLRTTEWGTGRQRHELIDLGEKLIFPAKVFVFVWGILQHWRRIMACPGVQAIMVDGAERPIVVPDVQMDRIQILQAELLAPKRKRRKRYPPAQHRITLTTKGYPAI